ncbi:MAG: hypothetical protein WC366_02030 [Bacilli bacterium]|jgi:hypothetical protein
MRSKFAYISISCLALLTSCQSAGDSFAVRTICPSGAPTIAFYDQGNNENFETNSSPNLVLAQFQTNYYNAIVFDSISGLQSIKQYDLSFKLAKIITGGNFYIASINKDEGTEPTADDVLVSFGEGLIPDLVYKKLYEHWGWQANTSYVKSVAEAQAILKTGKTSGNVDVDYVFIAQPALNAAMLDITAATYGKVKVFKNIREEWKTLTGQEAIPQAAMFYRYDDYQNHSREFDTYTLALENRIIQGITQPENVKNVMDEYSSDLTIQAQKFGFNSNIMLHTQKDGANGFGLVNPDISVDVNSFLTYLGLETYEASYFL